jgi:alpha-tubulin suppressor-like RCC1 family protein
VSGYSHTCAVLEGGALRCWGRNEYGALGYGNKNDIGDNEHPSAAGNVNVGGPVAQIGVGATFNCALLVSGQVRCWGSETNGHLGYGRPLLGPIGDDETPASAGDVIVDTGGAGGR